ncbi:PEP-CTERM sorting domain-containing protein [Neptunomonas sp.]|uniref:PEP-CTERM sorting domain-containing protein n=1 Tax=Neptunomonas sp. TaxID=1971898 RepID=UPI0025F84D9B|nr:PEP-CTERM sorting domain-containing protein [Neptunomonas sp.]
MKRIKLTTITSILVLFYSGIVAATPIYWTDWTGTDQDLGAGFEGQGTITTSTSAVGVTYTNANGIGFYQSSGGTDYYQNARAGRDDTISPFTSNIVDNSPTGTDIVALSRAGNQTLAFSEAIANPVFAFVSLNGNGYSFLNQDFNILSVGGVDGNACGYWGCGGVTKNIIDIGGGDFRYELNSSNIGGSEPHGVIQFTGAFDTLAWDSASNEYWNGFTVGVQGTAVEIFPVDPNSVPEPGSIILFGLGLVTLATRFRNKS